MKALFSIILKQRNKDCPKSHPYIQADVFQIKKLKNIRAVPGE
jgi:hypothetical protein